MRLFRYIKVLWRAARDIPYVNRPEWEVEDAANLRAFLASGTGRKFAATLTALTVQEAMRSITVSGPELFYRCGYAAGYRGLIATVEQMADVPETEEAPMVGATADLDWMHGKH